MSPVIVKKMILLSVMIPLTAMAQNNDSYLPPLFTESHRLSKIEGLFPLIDTMYQEYAKENHVPGYSYGIILDGKLVHIGNGGYINLEKRFLLIPNPCSASHR